MILSNVSMQCINLQYQLQTGQSRIDHLVKSYQGKKFIINHVGFRSIEYFEKFQCMVASCFLNFSPMTYRPRAYGGSPSCLSECSLSAVI